MPRQTVTAVTRSLVKSTMLALTQAANVRVTVYLLDKQGYVIWADSKSAADPLLSVGASSFFRIFVVFSGLIVPNDIASYRVYATSD